MLKSLWVLSKHSFFNFRDDRCTRQAAAIAYYVLFSIVPVAIFLVSIFGFFLKSQGIREDVINQITDALPLSETDGRTSVTDVINNVEQISGAGFVLSLGATIWTASAMFGAIRGALNIVWDVDEPRPFFQGKLLDIAQVGGLTLFLLASMALTGGITALQNLSSEAAGPLANNSPVWRVLPLILPAFVSFAVFMLLYRIVPAAHPSWIEVLPGAVVATVLFELLKNTFAIYVANFGRYDAVYGTLAGVLLFLFYVYLAANITLIGAEVSHTYGELRAGMFEQEFQPGPPGPSMTQRAFNAVKGLFVRTG